MYKKSGYQQMFMVVVVFTNGRCFCTNKSEGVLSSGGGFVLGLLGKRSCLYKKTEKKDRSVRSFVFRKIFEKNFGSP